MLPGDCQIDPETVPVAARDEANPAFTARLYGRRHEVEELNRSFGEAGRGQGIVYFVAGPSGSGKTALVRSLRNTVVKKNGFFLEGKFNQYQRDIPLFAIRQALRQLVGELAAADPAEQRPWREKILAAVGNLGRLLTDLVPELHTLLGDQPPVPEISPVEAVHRFAAVLRSFLGVFCQAEHPVVLFIDDWQWADPASLAVLRKLQVHAELRFLLFIASYRDEEVDAVHPLTETVEQLRRDAIPVKQLNVRHLKRSQIRALLADVLQPTVDDLQGMAEAVYERSDGNPFFVWSLLEHLRAKHAIWFDSSSRVWRWKDGPLRDGNGGGGRDVVQLFARELHGLPLPCRDLLSLAACIGNQFDLEILAVVSRRTEAECRTLLQPARAREWIRPLSRALTGDATSATRDSYVFRHDRVQQAAYSLLAEDDVPAVRLQIGRLLSSQLGPDHLQHRLMEVTDHFNAGRSLIGEEAERLRLVELNIAAGSKARSATAYRAALHFHRIAGDQLRRPELARAFWNGHHDQAMRLFKEWAESEFLEGNHVQAEQCIQEAVSHAADPLEKAAALCVLIAQYTLLAKYPEAIDTGRLALATLGIELPVSDFEAARDREIKNVRRQLRGRSIASLRELPVMSNPRTLMATKVLITMGPPCYRADQRLWSVIVPKVVDLTLRYGHVPQVGYSHTAFGGLLGWVSSDFATAREFGALATTLMAEIFQTPSDQSDQSVFYLMIGSSLRHWFEHLSAASHDYAQAWETGLRSGNLQYAAYAFGHNMYCRFFQGIPLARLIEKSEQSLEFSRTRTNQWAIDLLEGGLHVFQTLLGSAPGEAGEGNWSDADYVQRVLAHHNTQVACIYRVLHAQALLVLGDYERGLTESDAADETIFTVGTQGLLPWPEHVFTRFLLMARLHPQADAARQATWRREMDRGLDQLACWAKHGPANYRHKHLLALAEVARLERRTRDALEYYEAAIREAREHGFTQWEAIAGEWAAELLHACGQGRLAQVYWQNAYLCYHRWGAAAKLRRMEAELRASVKAEFCEIEPPSADAESQRLVQALQVRLDHYLESRNEEASRLASDEQRHERERLIEELSQAAVHLREEVAERKKLENQLRQAQKMEAIGRLAGGVAHDFNNLLTVILTNIQFLHEEIATDDPRRGLAEAVADAGQRAAALTRQLLAFSRQNVLNPQVLDLNEVVRDTEKMLGRLIGEDIRLTTALDPSIRPVQVDPGQIGQVLLNLALNARDAMPQGGRLTIETSNVDWRTHAPPQAEVLPGRFVMLTMNDSGTGIPPDVRARVFEPFFTTKGVGKGTGLGLSVVHGIVRQSGGHVEIDSEPAAGTTFKIYLPAAEEEARTPHLTGPEKAPGGRETILVVEDEDVVRRLTVRILKSCGYRVLEASSGEEALQHRATRGGEIDLLVTDVVMPGMNGRELAESLQTEFPKLKVLFCSGYTDDAVLLRGVTHARDAFLQKPFTPQALAKRVRDALDCDPRGGDALTDSACLVPGEVEDRFRAALHEPAFRS